MYEYVDEDDEEELLWCLRGYPFTCPVMPPGEVDDPDLLLLLDAVCGNCQQRLEYERRHRSFAV